MKNLPVFSLTPNNVGMTIVASDVYLDDLCQTLITLADLSSTTNHQDFFLLSLEGNLRGIMPKSSITPRVQPKELSFNIVLPMLITELHALHQTAKLTDSSEAKETAKQLIDLLTSAMSQKSPQVAKSVKHWIINTPPFSDSYLYNVVMQFTAEAFINFSKSSKRLAVLPDLLELFTENSEPYQKYAKRMNEIASREKCLPQEIFFNANDQIYQDLFSGRIKW